METYCPLAMMAPTVIIGHFQAAPTVDDRWGRPTPQDKALKMAMQHLGLRNLTAPLRG